MEIFHVINFHRNQLENILLIGRTSTRQNTGQWVGVYFGTEKY